MKSNFEYHRVEGGVPIKSWTKGVQIEDLAMLQLENTSKLPFIFEHLAVMPDVHWGMGATIGSVLATKGAVVPAAVGVDIGCGMVAIRTNLKASHLPDNLHQIRLDIEAAVPHGRTDNGGKNDKGGWAEVPQYVLESWQGYLERAYGRVIAKHPKAKAFNTVNHLGTLGTGNHFIELCLDEEQNVWVMLHSGSRGLGNKIGMYFIERAKMEMERYFIGHYLPDKDLAYLVEKTELFDDYWDAVDMAQDFALANRNIMVRNVMFALMRHFPDAHGTEMAVNCHHNYVSREHHFDMNVIVTRKGAVRAREGDLGIIPGSMGTGSFIVRGLGNPDSFHSCSHGAGRAMSRNKAKETITMEDHALAMMGIEARLDKDVLDESPAAYKDIGAVMKAQEDLVEIVYRLKQVLNVKG